MHGAVSLVQMYHVAVLVSEHLHLDMLRLFDVFLDEDVAVSECLNGLVLRASKLRYKVCLVMDYSHSASAAAGCSLQHYRVARDLREFYSLAVTCDRCLDSRYARDAYFFGDQL